MVTTFLRVYLTLLGWTLLGILAQKFAPPKLWVWLSPHRVGRFLFWVGVPLTIVGFVQQAELSGPLWIPPLACWGAVMVSGGLAHLWLRLQDTLRATPIGMSWSEQQRGSFQLVSMLGNTGFMGLPISFALGGPTFFGWAVLYDMLGSLLSTFGLGVWVAGWYSRDHKIHPLYLLSHVVRTPALWGLGLGLSLKLTGIPEPLNWGLTRFAWTMVPIMLVLLGIRLAQVRHWGGFQRVGVALAIKLVVMPCVVGLGLLWTPLPVEGKVILIVQAGMPPAISTLILTEEYNLDRDVTVAALAMGGLTGLVTLPLWVILWGG